jgi:ubiquinone/menaquinone biosynthesis C-methylase UbiE
LPDLSAEHVFAERDGDGWRLGVLDLHNGRLAGPGRVPRRLVRRVLRRFARSVRDVPIAWTAALRFAVRLLRAAGVHGDAARGVLGSLPPLHTAQRYERAGKSATYAVRNPRRAARELALLQRVWPGRAGETVLDLPCGAGRLAPWLVEQRGHALLQADGARAMLQQARADGTAGRHLVQADARVMPFADAAVDGVVMFRFLHHLDGEARRAVVAEACRVARRFVTVSFFHPCSVHHLQRLLRRLTGAPATRFAVTRGRLAAEFARHGFVVSAHAAELPFARDLWLASFERIAGAGSR